MAKDFPNSIDYYPSKLKNRGIGGKAGVFVVVSADGCAERGVVVSPSGHAELDQASLAMALGGRYLPAERDGKPARDGFVFSVTFSATL